MIPCISISDLSMWDVNLLPLLRGGCILCTSPGMDTHTSNTLTAESLQFTSSQLPFHFTPGVFEYSAKAIENISQSKYLQTGRWLIIFASIITAELLTRSAFVVAMVLSGPLFFSLRRLESLRTYPCFT